MRKFEETISKKKENFFLFFFENIKKNVQKQKIYSFCFFAFFDFRKNFLPIVFFVKKIKKKTIGKNFIQKKRF